MGSGESPHRLLFVCTGNLCRSPMAAALADQVALELQEVATCNELHHKVEEIALLPEFIVAEPLRAGTLVAILPGWRGPDLSIHALYPRTRRLSRASRAFLDALVRDTER